MDRRTTFENRPSGTSLGILLLFALILPMSLMAQDQPASDPDTAVAEEQAAEEKAAQDEEAAHEALRALRTIYENAVNQNDLDLINPHLDDGFSGVMVTNDPVADLATLTSYWQGIQELMGEGATYTTTLDPELSWIHGDIAVAQGTTQDLVVMPNGKEFHFTSSFTAVLVNRDGQWKIRRMQGTMNPVDNVFVKASLRTASLVAGGGAGVGGLLVGLLVGFFRKRSG